MLVRKDYVTFDILGQQINLYSEETAYGRNTVAEIDDYYHHLGDEFPSISAAIFAWQETTNRELTNDELHQVMVDNHLISQGI